MPKISILLVDDDVECLNLAAEALSKEGYNISATSDGLEALEIFSTKHFQLSILDIHMPLMDGFEIFRQMLDIEIIPCIFVTADQSKELKLRAMDLGASSVLYKPLNPALLRYTVQKVIKAS